VSRTQKIAKIVSANQHLKTMKNQFAKKSALTIKNNDVKILPGFLTANCNWKIIYFVTSL
jgi:hypothetical protein